MKNVPGSKRILRVIRQPRDFVYADVQLEFTTKPEDEIDAKTLKLIINSAFKTLHGERGLAADLDILYFDPDYLRCYLRLSSRNLVVIRSALTAFSSWNGKNCNFVIHKICHSLSSLPIRCNNHGVKVR